MILFRAGLVWVGILIARVLHPPARLVAYRQDVTGGRHSVMRMGMCAVLLLCMLADGGPASAQTAGIPQAPSAPPASSSGGLEGSAGWLDLSDKTGERRSPLVIAVPPRTDALGLPKGWSFRFEPPATCTGCPDREGPPVTNANMLWQTNAAVVWQDGAGLVGLRVTGQRGARLPLFMGASGGATAVPMASDVDMSDPRMQWVLTLSAERAVLASANRTVWLFGDLYLPLGSIGRAPKTEAVRTPAQTALIGGVRIRSK